MRRGEDGEFAPSSANPSKPTSEAGSDPKDKPANSKERMTREEREEAYNRARQRIFGNMKESDSSGQGMSGGTPLDTGNETNAV